MIDMVTSHNGFTSDIELFTDENINNIKKSLFRLMIISSEPNAKQISKKEVSFDVYYNDKSGKKYDFIWDNKKFHKNYKKHAILFNEVFNFISNIDIYGIGLKLDQKHNTDDEIRWAYYLYTMPKNTSNADIAGVPKHVYLDSSLPMNAYTKDNPWNIEIGKQWLKDRQMALLENKDR